MAESSSENPSLIKRLPDDGNNSFSLQLGPVSKMKHAIGALSDIELNPQGTAMFEVDSKGVEITVQNNTENKALGFLQLNAKCLIKFEFRQPLKRKMINLNHINQHLNMASDEDIVTIWHGHESNELSFEIGYQPMANFGVELLQIDAEFQKVPNFSYACECVVLTEDLLKLIELAEATTDKSVTIDVSASSMTMKVGENSVTYDYDTRKGGIRGMSPGQMHHASFQWPYSKALKKTSFLTKGVFLCVRALCIVKDPKECFIWRFNLQ